MAKTRISTNVEHTVAKHVAAAADALGMSISAWLAMAAESELQRLDARKLVEQALEDAEQARRERGAAQEELKQVASHLGVPDTAEHCKQRIDEINTERDTAQEELETAEAKVKFYEKRGFWSRLRNDKPLFVKKKTVNLTG
jgi:chromosome segregation ATPase